MNPQEFISSKVVHHNGCWIWGKGHPLIYPTLRFGGKMHRAHRFSYQAFHGPIPPSLHILHSCDNPRCVNPHHLRAGTHRENMQDKIKFPKPPRVSTRTKLTPEQVLEIQASPFTTRKLGKLYNVSASRISRLKRQNKIKCTYNESP